MEQMRPQDLIEKKRDRKELARDEVAFLIRGYTRDEIPDYQMAAWLMAAFLNGMSEAETQALVEEMLHSGVTLTHDQIAEPKVDKHSTGGVGDKTSLVIAPVAAACGVAVPMISGRALAHTGGTLDKLEAIPGFRTGLSLDEFRDVLKRCGLALIGQTKEIAPADRKLYALRDLTATVPFQPFMCASIMSKKLAEGIDGLVLDVKTGNGAFMREFEDARNLARMMASTGRAMGKRVVALITDMNQPLGRWVGNAVETMEAIETLRGDLEGDFAELCLELAARMLIAGGVESDLDIARDKARDAITSGRALERFRACVEAQGGDPRVFDDTKLLPQAGEQRVITAGRKGVIVGVETDEIGRVVMGWGGGRRRLEDRIDHAVGLRLHAKIGDQVDAGDPLVTAYYNDVSKIEEMSARLRAAYRIGGSAPKSEPLIKAVV
ncbi:MAG TPA: thymidine phosphorylase [Blastocatellia bacterium]|jgi:pyrimidine-nucleoside phosphorylase|nr:thymidine phosphorylase [Blastocatellia bacterium]